MKTIIAVGENNGHNRDVISNLNNCLIPKHASKWITRKECQVQPTSLKTVLTSVFLKLTDIQARNQGANCEMFVLQEGVRGTNGTTMKNTTVIMCSKEAL
jgi:hypothetical protein